MCVQDDLSKIMDLNNINKKFPIFFSYTHTNILNKKTFCARSCEQKEMKKRRKKKVEIVCEPIK